MTANKSNIKNQSDPNQRLMAKLNVAKRAKPQSFACGYMRSETKAAYTTCQIWK